MLIHVFQYIVTVSTQNNYDSALLTKAVHNKVELEFIGRVKHQDDSTLKRLP